MEAYYNIREPGSYSGAHALYKLMRSKGIDTTHKQVRDWLATQDAYNLHKPIRRRFPRRKIYARGIDYLWQADLVDVAHLAEHNDGYRYLLTIIDVFSKHAFVSALKKKDAKSVSAAFDNVVTDSGRKPQKLQTDKGKEFVNETFQTLLQRHSIQFYTSQNEDIKASVAERFNRTLKTKMWRYFTHRNTYKFIDVLQDLVYSYNHTYHRTIGRAPADVTIANAPNVYKRTYGEDGARLSEKVATLKIGDKVRISKTRQAFDKGYLPNWTEEIFTVEEVIRTDPPTYRIIDFDGEAIAGTFYGNELQRVVKINNVYKIEKIIRTRRRREGGKEFLVKWRGYPDKFNSWVAESDMTDAI